MNLIIAAKEERHTYTYKLLCNELLDDNMNTLGINVQGFLFDKIRRQMIMWIYTRRDKLTFIE